MTITSTTTTDSLNCPPGSHRRFPPTRREDHSGPSLQDLHYLPRRHPNAPIHNQEYEQHHNLYFRSQKRYFQFHNFYFDVANFKRQTQSKRGRISPPSRNPANIWRGDVPYILYSISIAHALSLCSVYKALLILKYSRLLACLHDGTNSSFVNRKS